MNYYPTNFYSNYPPQYTNNFGQANIQSPQQISALSGKIVDSIDVAKVSDIPFGSYGVFPKADFSEVYIKTWNNNGTTSLTTFKPIVEEAKPENSELIARIEQLEKAVNELTAKKKKEETPKRKELNIGDY